MGNAWRCVLPAILKSSVVLVFLICSSELASQTAPGTPATTPSQATQAAQSVGPPRIPADQIPEEVPEDELAPAALKLDLSTAPPIIQALYQATRETKESEILARLEQAKALLERGADLRATDPQGRTALHWAVFGSSYSPQQKVLVAYEDLADAMITRGVDINREDVYQNTALDYLLYSPSFEMQTLLLENGANSGFLAGFYQPSEQCPVPGARPSPAVPIAAS